MDKPAREIDSWARKTGQDTARPVKRSPAKPAAKPAKAKPVAKPAKTKPAAKAEPKLSRLTTANSVIVVPEGCIATLLLKLVAKDPKRRVYAPWLLVGRYEQMAMSTPYTFNGGDTVRCDIPEGFPISLSELEQYLIKFLAAEGNLGGEPPTINGKGKD